MSIIRIDRFKNTRVVRDEGTTILVGSMKKLGVFASTSLTVRLEPDRWSVSLAEGFHRYSAFKELGEKFALCNVLHPDTPDLVLRMLGDGENMKNTSIVKYAVFDALHGIRQYAADMRDDFEYEFQSLSAHDIEAHRQVAYIYWMDVRDSEDPVQVMKPSQAYDLFKVLPMISSMNAGRFGVIVRIVKTLSGNPAAWTMLDDYNQLIGPFSIANMEEVVKATDSWKNSEMQDRGIPLILSRIVRLWEAERMRLTRSNTKDENADPVPAKPPTRKYAFNMILFMSNK